MSKTQKDKVIKELRSIRNVGPAIAEKLYLAGVRGREEVLGGNPEALYEKLRLELGPELDRCVLYVLRGAKADKPWPQCSDRNLDALASRKGRR